LNAPTVIVRRDGGPNGGVRRKSSPPDFVGIGMAKSGTSWLDSVLRGHPEIWMPPVKELHFLDEFFLSSGRPARYWSSDPYARARWRRYFVSEGKKAIRFPTAQRIDWTARFLFGRRDFDWYERLFQPGRGRVRGEFTPDYAVLRRADIAAIHRRLEGTRIVLQLRNPIERAWSHARMELIGKTGTRNRVPTERELRTFLIADRGVVSRGRYADIITNWEAEFGRDRIFVGLYDDLVEDKRAFLRSVLAFLGVDANWQPATDIDRAVFRGPEADMPAWVGRELTELYAADIDFVAGYLGRPEIAARWRGD
jgi:hypothetical protein